VSLSKGSEWAGGGVVRFGRRRFRMGLWSRRGEELRELNYRLPVESEAEQHLSQAESLHCRETPGENYTHLDIDALAQAHMLSDSYRDTCTLNI